MPVHPLGKAALERAGLGFGTWKPSIVFGNCRPFIEERLPVLRRPAVAVSSKQSDDPRLVSSYGVQHPGCGLPIGIENQVSARDADADPVLLRHS